MIAASWATQGGRLSVGPWRLGKPDGGRAGARTVSAGQDGRCAFSLAQARWVKASSESTSESGSLPACAVALLATLQGSTKTGHSNR